MLLLFLMKDYFFRSRLQEELASRSAVYPRYSLRNFAKDLELNAGALSQILAGKRNPSFKMAKKIMTSIEMTPEEQSRFIESLGKVQRSRGLKRLNPEFRKRVPRLSPDPVREISQEPFRVVSDWYHYAILEMTFLPDFRSEPDWIARSLGITEVETKLAIDRLVFLQLLERKGNKLIKTNANLSAADRSITTPALKKRQRQILEKSIQSLIADPIEERNHSACTMAIDIRKIPEAKKRIQKFTRQLCKFLESGSRDTVVEMQISLFPVMKERG